MSTLSFPYQRVAAYGPPAYRRDSVFEFAVERQVHFALPDAADDTVRGQFLHLRRFTPAAIAIYQEVEGSCIKLFARRGQRVGGFAHFAALHTRHGWQVVDAPVDGSFWSPRKNSRTITDGAQPGLFDAPPQLPRHVVPRDKDATYVSLLAGFVHGGGLVYDAFVDAAWLSAHTTTLPFVLRRDFLFLQRWSTVDDEGEDTDDVTKLSQRRQRFVGLSKTMRACAGDGSVDTKFLFAESTELQLGLLRSLTPARIALYESSATRQAFVRTHERQGEPTEHLLDAAFARTPRGWLPLTPGAVYYDSSHGRATRPAVRYDSLLDDGRPALYFRGLFDAWLYAGGVRFDVPDPIPEANRYGHQYIKPQANLHVRRWRACASAASRPTLEAWGQLFAVPLPFVATALPADEPKALRQRGPSAGLPEPVGTARQSPLGAWTTVLYGPQGWSVDAPQLPPASADLFAEQEQGVHVDVDKASTASSPRPPARRLTWAGTSSLGALTNTPTNDAPAPSPKPLQRGPR